MHGGEEHIKENSVQFNPYIFTLFHDSGYVDEIGGVCISLVPSEQFKGG